MNSRIYLYTLILIVISIGIGSCATPVPPTGGPADKEGPVIEYTEPETGTTNFSGRTFVFQFNEYVSRSSVADAITVEPDLGIDYDLSWKRKRLTIEFKEDFPDSTTMIIKLGAEITDTRSNKMGEQVTMAISTGDEIDSGEIRGRVLMAEDGTGAEERKVLLYRVPVDLTRKANYEAQTDTGGVFLFSYLAPGRYQALMVNDRNRNKLWDKELESAYPFFEEYITLSKEGSDTLDVIYTTLVDSIAPTLQGVGLFSMNRMRLRFSENIKFQDDAELLIADSAGQPYTTAYPLYVSPKESFAGFAYSQAPLEQGKTYNLSFSGITDLADNPADSTQFEFTGTDQEDTTSQRIISANGENGLLQDEVFKVTYAAPITEPELTDSVVVIEDNIDFSDWPEIETVRNQLLIKPQNEWIEGVDYQFMVWNPQTLRRSLYEPEVWDSTEYGEIELTLNNADSADIHIVELLDKDGEQIYRGAIGVSEIIGGLPPLSYTLKLFKDENGNDVWDRGTVIPYVAPEPYYVQKNVKVQQGFTSGLQINFE